MKNVKVKVKNILGVVLAVTLLLGVGLLVYFKILPQFSLFGSSALSVASGNTPAQVYLNGRLLGTTPLKKQTISLKKGLLRVAGTQNVWEENVTFTAGTETTLNLDLGVSPTFSGSDLVWLEKTKAEPSLSIVSDPSGSLVTIDGVEVGKTPLSLNLAAGPHLVKISQDNYQARSLNIMARTGYKINISSRLFLLPMPKLAELNSNNEAVKIYSISGESPLLSSDLATWAAAVAYWQVETEASLAATFSYLLDSNGGAYDRGGTLLTNFAGEVPAKFLVGYLSKPGETALSAPAAEALAKILSGGKPRLVKILPTGQTWLRVRGAPNGEEVGRATVGQTYPKVLEQNGWTEIILENGQKGWVSSTYVSEVKETVTPPPDQ